MLENKLIITGSLSKGAGSTFLAINLAKASIDDCVCEVKRLII